MRVQNSREPFLLVVLLAASREHTGDLREHADRVHRIDVRDHVAVRVLVLEEERTKVRLPATHHLLYRRNHGGIPDDDCLVETGEEGPTRDGECQYLGVDFGDRLLRY